LSLAAQPAQWSAIAPHRGASTECLTGRSRRPGADVEARRVAAEAKKLNLEVVKKDGEVSFCRSNVVTASLPKDRQLLYGPEQVEVMQGQGASIRGK